MQRDRSGMRASATAFLGRSRIGGALLGSRSTGDPVPSDTVEVRQLLAADSFRADVSKLAAKLGMSSADAMTEAAGYLREMSALHNKRVDTWQRFASWLTRGYDIVVDDDGLAELRRLDRKHALIFLISHRSYLDEFILPPLVRPDTCHPCIGWRCARSSARWWPTGPTCAGR